MLNKKQLAIVHVAKSKVGMSDEDYREMLSGRFGVESSRDLNRGQFDELMLHFEGLGFENKAKRYVKPAENKKRLVAKIKKQMEACELADGYVDGIARRMFKLDSWIWCDPRQLHKIVAALEYHKKRMEARDGK